MAGAQTKRAFTLIELMAVVVLVSIVAATVTVHLDGFTEQGRLRSAARQIGALYRTARAQAVSSGRPALLEYDVGSDRVRVLRPVLRDHELKWSGGEGFRLGPRVVIRSVRLGRGQAASSQRMHQDTVVCLINSGGLGVDHRVELVSGRSAVRVVIDGITGQETLQTIDPVDGDRG